MASFWVFTTWAATSSENTHHIDPVVEDEEIIGGIGGTGLRDMERPEMLERPEFDTDDILDGSSSLEDVSDVIDDNEITNP